MRTPAALRKLDDKVIGDRFRSGDSDGDHDGAHDGGHERGRQDQKADGGRRGAGRSEATEPYPEETRTRVVERDPGKAPASGNGLSEALAITYRIASLVFLALALTVALGILFTVVSTNPDNVIVSTVLDVAETVAGPFRDIFTAGDAQRQLVTNYGFAAALYLLAAVLVTKLPRGKR